MKNFKRFIVPVALCAVLIGAGIAVFMKGVPKSDKPDYFVQEKAGLNRLIQNSSEIHRMWIEGEESREWSLMKADCLKYLEVNQKFDESLLRCNPILLQCHALFSKNLNYKIINLEEVKNLPYRYLTKSNSSYGGLREVGVAMTIEDPATKRKLDIFLEDQCQEVYLEQRAYAYGEQVQEKDAEDYRFDNFNRHIYFDTHLVTNGEINQWIRFGNPDFTRGLREKKGDDLFLPAVDLTFNQMENYCSFKGRQVMLAHIFDAATFLPMDLGDKIPKRNLRSPYYWTKKASEYKSDCNLIYSKDCLSKKAYSLNSTEPSWSGLRDSMGGVFEAFRNPIDPDSNLKASSFYFDSKSSWHKLGFRAGWDGEGFDLRNFDFRGLNPFVAVEKFQVGFRCMREVMQ
ncbi:hypothetical protein C0V70_16515 [Bacteriovorax stolpii]|uniref:Uncharacterized protein n=1 Tax=Bacteriovorax stolpii TaxID=960 RepID=A0A2K9NVY8_BACTC|nr:hypothetical protein [Bacteriovorax stolpii]AUN99681.1 hypothetical protein C0V70_16515 [Bacteriovorax stolpii]TDP51313.1 hypothetical protein C8D79_3485 [Bacteriovorax stolpii]